MKRVFKKAFLFSLPLLLLLFFAEARLRSIKTIYERKKEEIEKDISNIDILVFGNSHGRDAIVPKIFSNTAYNFSLPSQSLLYNEKILEKYITSLRALKTVIITIDYHSFYFIDQELSAFYNDKVFDVRNGNYHFWLTSENLSSFFFVYGALPSLGYLYEKPQPAFLQDGWEPEPSADSSLLNERTGILRAADHNNLAVKNDKLKDLLSGSLINMITLLHKNGIRPVLVSTPVFHTYYDQLDKKILGWNKKTIENIAARYNAPYLDFMNDSRFTDPDFSDVDHLSKTGAAKFSMMIKPFITGI